MTLPVPSQRTWSVGDIVTAAMMNANVRDAVNFLAQPPLFVGYQTVAQSLPATTWTAISLDSSLADSYSGHSNTVNNPRYTAAVTGYYFVFGMVAFASNSTGARFAGIYANGSPSTYGPASSEAAVSAYQTLSYALALVPLAAGGYVDLRAYTNAAVSTQVGSAGQASMMAAWWVHS